MGRYRSIVAFAIASALLTAVLPLALDAQERETFSDFRGRSEYTSEDLARALFPDGRPGEKALGPRPTGTVALNVFFDTNSHRILAQYHADLDKLGTVLTSPQYSEFRVQIEGHTDSIGPDRYNQLLSERRAESIKQYLVQKFAIAPQRLLVKGYGKSQPIETNDTPEGRGKNRRVTVVNRWERVN